MASYKATDIQNALNKQGYKLDVDGIIGPKTTAAIKDYQQKNGLAVDGIVGDKTWGALNKAQNSTPSAPTATAPAETKAPTFENAPYQKSDAVAQAEMLLQQQLTQKPGAYQSTWQQQLNDTLQQILNREKFSYDLNGDMLYQQYKDQYTTQGKLAMMDAMGQAAAMSGGYGNSYAQTAGQQAYQGYLQQLNDRVPELYQLALNQYNAEGDSLNQNAALMAQMEAQDYGRYRDSVSDYYTELDRLTQDARYQAETEYGRWADERSFSYGQYSDDRAYGYQTERDQIADEQWQKTFDEGVRQFNQQYALSAKKSSGGGGGSGSGGGDGSGSGDGRTKEETKKIQEKLRKAGYDIAVDGVWGPKTEAAYEDWRNSESEFVSIEDDIAMQDSVPKETSNTKLFKASVMTKTEFARHGGKATVGGKTYKNYQQYIEACLAKWADNGIPNSNKTLTDGEVIWLMDQYGFN